MFLVPIHLTSAYVCRFIDPSAPFQSTFISTIGVDFEIISMQCADKLVKLQMWDTAGQERFHAITKTYYRGAQGIMMVYDITDPHSFEDIQSKWLMTVREFGKPDVPLVVVGNKKDLEATSKKHVSAEVVREWCLDNNIIFVETSARTGEGVEETFRKLVEAMIEEGHGAVNRGSDAGVGAKVGKGITLTSSYASLLSPSCCT
jgi:small GTP-binding protein